MKDQDLIGLEIRRRIYNYILKYPGLHFREISREMKIPKTTLSYHLEYLKNREFILSKSDGRFVRYFAAKKTGNKDKKLLNIIRNDTTRHVILVILHYICASQIDISKELEKHPTTIGPHIKKLIDLEIIETAPVGEGVVYRLRDNCVIERKPIGNEIIYRIKQPKIVYDVLMTYKNTLLDRGLTKITLEMIDYYSSEGMPEKMKSSKKYIKDLEKTLYDIFPHPYHS